MVSMISSLLSLLLFNVTFSLLVTGKSPSDAPTPSPMPSSSSQPPPSAPAPHPPTPVPSSTSSAPAPTKRPPTPGPTKRPPTPGPSYNSSAPASVPPPPSCTCTLSLKTVVACSVVLIQGGGYGLPRNICCRGLQGLRKEVVYSCLCYVLKSNVMGQPLVDLTVPAAVKIMSLACNF